MVPDPLPLPTVEPERRLELPIEPSAEVPPAVTADPPPERVPEHPLEHLAEPEVPASSQPADPMAEDQELTHAEHPADAISSVETQVPPVSREGVARQPAPQPTGVTVDLPPPRPLAPAPGPTTRLTYALVGLLGVMLFAGALVSMFRQANVANLVAGLVGVAFMAPAAGHFLFNALSGRPSNSAYPRP